MRDEGEYLTRVEKNMEKVLIKITKEIVCVYIHTTRCGYEC